MSSPLIFILPPPPDLYIVSGSIFSSGSQTFANTASLPPKVTLTTPFQDPPHSFRAQTVQDMAYVVPVPFLTRTDIYDIGIPSDIPPISYAIRSRTTSHNLLVTINIPPHLALNTLNQFTLAPTKTVIVTVSFNDKYVATQLLGGTFASTMSIDVFPQNVQGPVFIDTTIVPPDNPNPVPSTATPPVDSTGSLPSVVIPILQPITASVPSGPPKLFWRNGQTGETVEGTPPANWIVGSDGAIYPPLAELLAEQPIPITTAYNLTGKYREYLDAAVAGNVENAKAIAEFDSQQSLLDWPLWNIAAVELIAKNIQIAYLGYVSASVKPFSPPWPSSPPIGTSSFGHLVT